jgi:RNA polymerase sigma-70 factor (ECF subfamily)
MSFPHSAPEEVSRAEHARWFAEEVQPHERRLRSWLLARFPDLREIDDVLQETYVRLLRARNSGGVRSVPAFMFIAARNAACDVFRRRKPNLIQSVEDMVALDVLDEGPDAAELTAIKQELEILAAAMRTLPDRCREVFTLRKIYGLPQKEIATRLGIAEHTVEIHVCKGARLCAAFMRANGISRS